MEAPAHAQSVALGRIVLHVDVDAFFCQVERLRNPGLVGIPIVVQQHQDIIAIDHAAWAAGVVKHMQPAQARALLHKIGGRVVHVFMEEGVRVSYRPYREASGALMRLLKRFVNARVVERASIDEAYVLCAPPQMGVVAGVQRTAAAADPWDMGPGMALAASIRQAAASELGLAVSVGVAPNKLLAKLASRAAKPDGQLALESGAAVDRLLASTPVGCLPGMGGKVADALRRLGVTSAAGLRAFSAPQLVETLGLSPKHAGTLAEWAWGRDEAPVADKGPPKSLQAQITLTPVPLRMHTRDAATVSAAGGAPGVLEPLPVAAPDTGRRLGMVVRAMAGDLVGRVLLDRHTEDRWPGKLGVSLVVYPSGRAVSRTAAFPTPGLLATGAAAGRRATSPPPAAAQPQQQRQEGAAGGSQGEHVSSGEGSEAGGQLGDGAHEAGVFDGAAAAAGQALLPAPGAAAAGSAFAVAAGWGEKEYAGPGSGALLDAVATCALGMLQALLTGMPTDQVIVQIHLSASSFAPYESSASASIRSFFAPAVVRPLGHGAEAAAAVATATQAAGGAGAGAAREPATEPEQPMAPALRLAAPGAEHLGGIEAGAKRKRSPVTGTDAGQGGMQQQGRPGSDAGAAAGAGEAPRLTQLLMDLSRAEVTAEEAERQLAELLAAHAAARRLQQAGGR